VGRRDYPPEFRRRHCCIWPEGAAGRWQSGAASRPDGCQKCSKRSILGIADGVQVLWWRTPVLVIGRCNSAVQGGRWGDWAGGRATPGSGG